MEYLTDDHKTCETMPIGTIMVNRMHKNRYTDEIYFEVVQYTAEDRYGVIAECQEEWLADSICEIAKSVDNGEKGCPLCGEG